MVNSLENFKYVFDKALEGKFIDRMDQNQEIFARYINDPAFAKVVAEFLRKQVYEQIRADARVEKVQQNRCAAAPTERLPGTREHTQRHTGESSPSSLGWGWGKPPGGSPGPGKKSSSTRR
jgi:hypothetical protein